MTKVTGPSFQLVEEISWDELKLNGGFGPRKTPLLIKGAVKMWPAWDQWSFQSLSELRRADGSEIIFRFQNGLVEQGVTAQPLDLPISPYLRDLSQTAEQGKLTKRTDIGLCSDQQLQQIKKGEQFHLNWSYMKSFKPNKIYLAQWDILKEFPRLKKDFAITQLWPGLRWTWEFVFMGPANTVTGLHYDFPNNWFCQVQGTKEVILFPPSEEKHMCTSKKYDWGATLSDINISKLDEQPNELASFEKAKGLYARVEAGDALFIPKRTWHGVVALEPSISLAVFGLTPLEIILGGGPSEFKGLLHKLHLYRWGNCTCHRMATIQKQEADQKAKKAA